MSATAGKTRCYSAHETERAGALFAGAMILVILLLNRFTSLGRSNAHIKIEMNFLHNWYSLAYTVLFFGLSFYIGNGRTIGKRLMGIRVVSLVHHRLSLWHSVERALGYGASALELGFGFLQYFIHPNRRTVHDRIAETTGSERLAGLPQRTDVAHTVAQAFAWRGAGFHSSAGRAGYNPAPRKPGYRYRGC